MQIILQKILPDFFTNENAGQSQVWSHSIHFTKGEHVLLVAPSGSGKTSLMHFLYGLRKDFSGNILYNGNDIRFFDGEKMAAYRQQSVSIIFQDLRLFNKHTAIQNIEIKRLLSPYHGKSNILDMAKRLGIENKLHSQCGTCSQGEKQRIAIIRALQQPFDFLFLDEPFSHLDEANTVTAMELIQEEAAERKASIILAELEVPAYFKDAKILKV